VGVCFLVLDEETKEIFSQENHIVIIVNINEKGFKVTTCTVDLLWCVSEV